LLVNREHLLKIFESVAPGLSPKESVEQSSSLVFIDGEVWTFNTELACHRASPLPGIEGALAAKPLLDYLSKAPDDDLDVEQSGTEMVIKGKGRRTKFKFEAEVLLPVGDVEVAEVWHPMPTDFAEAVGVVASCASIDEKQNYRMKCVHLTPSFMEATDSMQIARYPLALPIKRDTLVRADTLAKLAGYDMTEMGETASWLHFRNPGGLVISCRRHIDDYRDLTPFLQTPDSTPVVLPGSLEEVVARAEIFSGENALSNRIIVDLRQDQMIIRGAGARGSHEEKKEVKYDGARMRFLISPKLLLSISKRGTECGVGQGRLAINGGKFQYVTCTEVEEKMEVMGQ
jgi:hypothetical protein